MDDRYQLLEVLGEGGFATVYAAHDRRIKGPVAVKILKIGAARRNTGGSRSRS
ncbi:hypothetical protein [Nannocystis pusilla]|uniref:hypothetical protein n=1 Tax=Nannocystis pusilla TaxID=889268 RepID=UPI003B80693F